MIQVQRYHRGLKEIWNAFNSQAVNGTFFFNRTFIEYHGSRFTDHSLLFYHKNSLIALLPLHEDNTVISSHQGLSFGGFIISAKVDVLLMLQLFENLKIYAVQHGFTTLIYKAPPSVYLGQPTQDDLFALYQHQAVLQHRNLISVLNLKEPIAYSKLRQRCLKRAKELNLTICFSEDIEAFMHLVQQVHKRSKLKSPTHSVAEIKYLMQAFPENIGLMAAYAEQELVGGVLLFKHRQVVNLQYIASSAVGKQKHALDLLVHAVITKYQNQVKYLSFGSSHDEREPYHLNTSLVQNKSSYGARGVVQDTYQLNF
ncbi:GNAT family N-acetyltransferase [Adhaeribacter swui]|uniref:GNAT family N-acetyltransferase n=1 Tax=Adhaeribacter swui TaxID=2086471 RepID=A0A7G7GCL9_9BACT|nr:GNAT family N-acetyltransferase [Adhaeribacter swui]QNF34903.1 GNAT family N-acetyltransferase [Adhaeribacter swui]